jgi:hypothetical protein
VKKHFCSRAAHFLFLSISFTTHDSKPFKENLQQQGLAKKRPEGTSKKKNSNLSYWKSRNLSPAHKTNPPKKPQIEIWHKSNPQLVDLS